MKRPAPGALALLTGAGAACLCLILRQWQRGLRLDWDIDAFLLMAWRLHQGEWLFLDFYDPKWPHVPWAYLPGALSGSLLVHLLVSWLALLATALAITAFGRALRPGAPVGISTPLAAGVLYLLVAPLLPGGGIGHLEVYANAALAAGLWALAVAWRHPLRLGALAGGLAIGVGVGLRPNLLIPVLATAGAALVLVPGLGRSRRWLGVALAGAALGVVGPFLPYLLRPGGARAAWLGAVAVLGDWNRAMYPPLSLGGFGKELLLLYNPRVLGLPGLALALGGLALLLLAGLRRGRAGRPVLLLFAVWQGALWLSYALSHIHHHYVLMDLAGLCLALAALPAARLRGLPLALLLALLIAVLFYPLKPLSTVDQRRVREEDTLMSWLRRPDSGTFQSPEWLGPHWRLHSPQATKAVHPVWSLQILDSPLNQAASVRALGLGSSWSERCTEWLAAKPSVLVVSPGTAARCRLEQRREWRNISERVGLGPASTFRVFRRVVPTTPPEAGMAGTAR